ncbi:Trm112 family protein [Stenotrophomonas sp. AB1(2024)]|uniref:Trm112 family protein n=1 Tax=Stenotrophomonas sp. AB1(2024) TaxID=3132215 RepID=UPI0030ADACE0
MDRKVIDLLCAPRTGQRLSLLDPKGLDALNRAIGAGTVSNVDGNALDQPLREALVTLDRRQIFRVNDGIPVLLPEEAIDTAQIADFPK